MKGRLALLAGSLSLLALVQHPALASEPPVAVDDVGSTPCAESVTIYPLANDSDPSGEAIRIVNADQPELGGTRTVDPDGQGIVYSPVARQDGGSLCSLTDYFRYTITNQSGATASATIYVNVEGSAQMTTPGDISVKENGRKVKLIASLAGRGTWGVQVFDGTAFLGEDYGTPRVTEHTTRPHYVKVIIPIIDDLQPEPRETFSVQWYGDIVSGPEVTTVTIIDND